MKTQKNSKLRHAEYYGMTEIFDELHESAQRGKMFKNLMKHIISEENLLLAYRNIKRNTGSYTPSCDGLTIDDIEKIPQKIFLCQMKNRFSSYKPRKVKRVDIPKSNGKTRPLGIPSIWDRLIQQSILQVLEPICEAKFCTRSYGFRPDRSTEHAIADMSRRVNIQSLTYVVDVDIKGFFDEVNHCKLMRQIWTLGIRDKQLLVILRKILKAPIELPNKTTILPKKGTPQGGVLSPLLANINLNEFDWWISKQWETIQTKDLKPYVDEPTRLECYHKIHDKLKKTTTLKPMYIVRYADDFKILTNTRTNAEKIFYATKNWLEKRLKLPISEEKSGITNLKKESSYFLGFSLKVEKKGKKNKLPKWIVKTNISPDSILKETTKLKKQIKVIQCSPNSNITLKEIGRYNSMIIGIHNYYNIATNVSSNLKKSNFELRTMMYNRFPKESRRDKTNPNGFTAKGTYTGKDIGISKYKKSKSMRYLMKLPIIPLSYVRFRAPRNKKRAINRYSSEGRKFIHKELKTVTEKQLSWLRTHPIYGLRGTLELNDNRISLYVAQNGKCGITGIDLAPNEIHCHHKIAWSKTRDDSYKNLVIVSGDSHKLIHAKTFETIKHYVDKIKLSESQLAKLNMYRKFVGNTEIGNHEEITEQLTLF